MVLKEDSVPTAKFPTDAHDGDPSLSRHHSVSSPPSIFYFMLQVLQIALKMYYWLYGEEARERLEGDCFS